MSPGLTSPASVLYRDEERLLSTGEAMDLYLSEILPSKLRLDQLYVRHHSFWGDLDVVFWTLLVLLPKASTYSPGEKRLFAGPISLFMRYHMSWLLVDLVTFVAMGLVGLLWRQLGPLNGGWLPAIVLAVGFAALFSLVNSAQGVNRIDWDRGHYLVMGADWALSEDFTVLVVGCRDCNRVVDWERFNQIDFTYQRERLYSLARKWGVRGVLPERNSIGAPNIELRREHVNVLHGMDGVLGFNTLPTTKPPLIEGLAIGLSHNGFKVPKAASDELRAYQVELSTVGHPKFGAPEGLHDDWVIALALCWYAMTSGGVSLVDDPFANW